MQEQIDNKSKLCEAEGSKNPAGVDECRDSQQTVGSSTVHEEQPEVAEDAHLPMDRRLDGRPELRLSGVNFALGLCVVALSMIVVALVCARQMPIPGDVSDEELGFLVTAKPFYLNYQTAPVDIPEWNRHWQKLHLDSYPGPGKSLQSCLRDGRTSLELAIEVANRHDQDYVAAMLCQAESLKDIAATADRLFDFELAYDSLSRAYEIDRQMVGPCHFATLSDETFLQLCENRRKMPVTAYSNEHGLKSWKLSKESFGEENSFVSGNFLQEGLHSQGLRLWKEYSLPTTFGDYVAHEEGLAYKDLAECQPYWADFTYRRLLHEVTRKCGLRSTELRHLGESYVGVLKSQGRLVEAKSIAMHLHLSASGQ